MKAIEKQIALHKKVLKSFQHVAANPATPHQFIEDEQRTIDDIGVDLENLKINQ